MFKQRYNPIDDASRQRDHRLGELLRAWPGIEPGDAFEAGVMQRIAVGKKPGSRRFVRARRLRAWRPVRPVRVTSAAAAAAVIIAVGVGIVTFRTAPVRQASHPLLHQHTVAGAYVALARGETR